MSITYWNGEVVERMTPERAAAVRHLVVRWADGYECVTGGADPGRQAKEFIKTFDAVKSTAK